MSKNVLILIIVLVLAAGGYYFLKGDGAEDVRGAVLDEIRLVVENFPEAPPMFPPDKNSSE